MKSEALNADISASVSGETPRDVAEKGEEAELLKAVVETGEEEDDAALESICFAESEEGEEAEMASSDAEAAAGTGARGNAVDTCSTIVTGGFEASWPDESGGACASR